MDPLPRSCPEEGCLDYRHTYVGDGRAGKGKDDILRLRC